MMGTFTLLGQSYPTHRGRNLPRFNLTDDDRHTEPKFYRLQVTAISSETQY